MGTSRASKDLLMQYALNDLSGAAKPLKKKIYPYQQTKPSNVIHERPWKAPKYEGANFIAK
jgi:hypothetical protein